MDHRDVAIFENNPSGFHVSAFLTKSFLVPVPIEIGVSSANIVKGCN